MIDQASDPLGIVLAATAAILLSFSSIFIRKGTDTGKASEATLFILFGNVVVLVSLATVLYYPSYGVTPLTGLVFAVAGLSGALAGRAFHYASIKLVGTSRSEPIKAAQPFFASILAIMFLNETATIIHLFGIIAIVVGIAVVTWEPETERERNWANREYRLGVLFALLAAVFCGIEPPFIKYGLDVGTPFVSGLSIYISVGFIGFAAYLRLRGDIPTRDVLTDGNLRWYVLAALANSAFLLSYYLGLRVADVVVVVPILQTSPLLVLLLSFWLLPTWSGSRNGSYWGLVSSSSVRF